ncbi:MAG: DHHA1 domain-containing protein, partial [Anaerotignum sp.]
KGAMALFGEKYGDVVRVVDMGGYSVELCGGAHLTNTAQAGSFKILSENGVAAGVRRIEAVTGTEALKHYQTQEDELKEVCRRVKATPTKLLARVEQLVAEQKELEKELEKLKAKMAGGVADDILNSKIDINGVSVLVAEIKDLDGNGMRTLGDQLKNKLGSGIVVLAGGAEGKVNLMVMATDDAVVKGAHAGNIIKEAAAVCGGGGGGRPNMAQAGGKDVTKITAALEKAKEVIATQIK